MSNLLSAEDWAAFNGAINDAQDTLFNKTIIWRRAVSTLDRFKEDGPYTFNDTTIVVLINYNFFRTWPVTNNTETGDQDRESIQVIFTKDYLRNLGYLNDDGYLNFNPTMDRFIIDGKEHKADGDSPASQANGDDALFFIIMRREEKITGS